MNQRTKTAIFETIQTFYFHNNISNTSYFYMNSHLLPNLSDQHSHAVYLYVNYKTVTKNNYF